MAGTFLWLIGLSLPIAGAVLYFATAGRGVEPPPQRPPTVADAGRARRRRGSRRRRPAPRSQRRRRRRPAPRAAVAAAVVASAPRRAAPAVEDRLIVVLSVKRPCWVSASVDGERRIERLLQPGEQQTIEVRREMVLTAGDASAITLTLNGAEARPLGRTGEVVTARFNLANYKDYLQARR